MSFLKIWGCDVYVKRLQPNKLDPKADKCIFVGYPKETVGYSFYHKTEGKVFVAKSGVFLEKRFIEKGLSGRTIELDEIIESEQDVQSSAAPEAVPEMPRAPEAPEPAPAAAPEINASVEPRRSGRLRLPVVRLEDEVLLLDNDEPATYNEAMMGPDSIKWQSAMKSEIESMYENQVWNLIDPPEGVKPIECKWIYKKKSDADGNVTVYKARLVAKDFRQIQGVDYDETFSPVAMLKSVRILLAIAAYFNYEI